MIDLNWKAVLAGGAVILVAVILLERQAKAAAVAVGNAINPVSDQNIFYKGASGVVQATTGNSTDTLGTWIFGLFHPGK